MLQTQQTAARRFAFSYLQETYWISPRFLWSYFSFGFRVHFSIPVAIYYFCLLCFYILLFLYPSNPSFAAFHIDFTRQSDNFINSSCWVSLTHCLKISFTSPYFSALKHFLCLRIFLSNPLDTLFWIPFITLKNLDGSWGKFAWNVSISQIILIKMDLHRLVLASGK